MMYRTELEIIKSHQQNLYLHRCAVKGKNVQINSKLGIKHFQDVIKYAQAFDLL